MSTIKETQNTTHKKAPLFFISAGDPSGDIHASHLVEAISRILPQARFIGFAGPQTATTCCDVKYDLTKFSAMMLKKAIVNLPNYLRILRKTDIIFQKERPDVVIIVDFPGFNWKIAKKAQKAGIPVVYFMPPQIWGWGQWRVKKMRKYVNLVLSCFSFEHEWFKNQNCNSTFISHPFFEEVRSRKLDNNFLLNLRAPVTVPSSNQTIRHSARYLTILPGSRDQEVQNNLPNLLETIQIILQETTDIKPIFAAFKESHAEYIKKIIQESNLDFPVYVGKTPELMRIATCCLSVSGSVSIELLSLCKPTVITYKISSFEYAVLRFLKRVKYITLTNLLYVHSLHGETPFYPRRFIPKSTDYTPRERELMLFPEFLLKTNSPKEIAKPLIRWLNNETSRRQCIAKLEALKKQNDIVSSPVLLAAQKIIQYLDL